MSRTGTRASTAVLLTALVLALAAFRYAHDIVKLAVEAPTVDFGIIWAFTAALWHGVDPFTRAGLAWIDGTLAVPRAGTPPTLAPGGYLVVLPFIALPFSVARALWFVVCQVSLATALVILYRRLRPDPLLGAAGLFVVLTFQPILEDVALGNVNLVVLLLVTVAIAAHLDGRTLATALPLAVAANLKPPYVALIPLLAWLGSMHAALLSAGLAIGLCVLAVLLFGGSWLAGYWLFLTAGSAPLHAWERNLSPHGALHRLLRVEGPSLPVEALSTALAVGVIALVLWVTREARLSTDGRLAPWAVALAALPLATPLAEENHFPVLLVPLAFALSRAREFATRDAVCFGAAVVLLASRYSLERFEVFARGLPSLALGGKLLGVIALTVLAARLARRDVAAEPARPA